MADESLGRSSLSPSRLICAFSACAYAPRIPFSKRPGRFNAPSFAPCCRILLLLGRGPRGAVQRRQTHRHMQLSLHGICTPFPHIEPCIVGNASPGGRETSLPVIAATRLTVPNANSANAAISTYGPVAAAGHGTSSTHKCLLRVWRHSDWWELWELWPRDLWCLELGRNVAAATV